MVPETPNPRRVVATADVAVTLVTVNAPVQLVLPLASVCNKLFADPLFDGNTNCVPADVLIGQPIEVFAVPFVKMTEGATRP